MGPKMGLYGIFKLILWIIHGLWQHPPGGPLAAVALGRHHLVGVVSFGRGCGRRGSPGVYTRCCTCTCTSLA